MNENDVRTAVETWLKDVVIGCGFCPFASQPYLNNQVLIHIDPASQDEEMLLALHAQLEHIEQKPNTEVETTLLVLPYYKSDFYSFNQFLELADALLEQQGWLGEFQIASFHPNYQFAETEPDDAENLTNRSPYPILHILREASLEAVLENYPDPDAIYEKNIRTARSLSEEKKHTLFPYLFTHH